MQYTSRSIQDCFLWHATSGSCYNARTAFTRITGRMTSTHCQLVGSQLNPSPSVFPRVIPPGLSRCCRILSAIETMLDSSRSSHAARTGPPSGGLIAHQTRSKLSRCLLREENRGNGVRVTHPVCTLVRLKHGFLPSGGTDTVQWPRSTPVSQCLQAG